MSSAFPVREISKEQIHESFSKLQNEKCDPGLSLSTVGNDITDYYFQLLRAKTKIGKWSHYSAWQDPVKRARIIQIDKQINRGSPSKIGTSSGLRDAMRMSIGSVNQFKPYIAICAVYKKFMPRRVLDISAGWGGRLIGAMSQNIDYIGIDSNKKLEPAYKKMIAEFSKESKSKVKMIFKKSQDVNYSSLKPYDMIFTSPPYFELEKYEGMEDFKDDQDFIDKYWIPTITPAWQNLSKGGHLVLNMPEAMYKPLIPLIGKYDKRIRMPLQSRFAYKDSAKRFEYIYVWKK